ncbi:MAG: hypothetical protein A3K67_07360 [Euryarchaeota archaeon RBG_16_62_10]|nr:MAG: hypothetical protein A3K67_07360 [Euryarchaeota archaeon RBG_16_62_10]
MTTKTARLNIRLPEGDLKELEAVRERTGVQSVSDVVREAIEGFLHDEVATWNSERLTALVPRALADEVEMFIASGEAADVSQAVTLALTGWVEEKKRFYLEGREALKQRIAEAVDERDTRKGMARAASRMRVQ